MSLSKKMPPAKSDRRPRILLLGNYRPALAVARVLNVAGYHVIMGKRGGEGFSEYSRFVDEAWEHPPVETDPSGLELALSVLLSERDDIKLIVPITEAFVMFFAETNPALPNGVTLVSPKADLVKTCADKTAMLSLADEKKVSVLPYAILSSGSNFKKLGHEVGLPMVIRPLSPGAKFDQKKAVIIESWPDYEQFVMRWCKPEHPILIQRRAIGGRVNLFFSARNGAVINNLQTHIIRTDALDGTGVAVDGVTGSTSPELLRDCQELVRALDYTGIGVAQFIVDPDTGDCCFLELNPRIAGSQAITEQMGLEMSLIAVQLATGENPTLPEKGRMPRVGIRYVWSYGDLRGLCSALARREIGAGGAALWATKLVWSALRAHRHMTWSWYDPIPSLMLFARQLVPSLERLSGTSGKAAASEQVQSDGDGQPATPRGL